MPLVDGSQRHVVEPCGQSRDDARYHGGHSDRPPEASDVGGGPSGAVAEIDAHGAAGTEHQFEVQGGHEVADRAELGRDHPGLD